MRQQADKKKENIQAATSKYLADLKLWQLAMRKPESRVQAALWSLAEQAIAEG